jgi:hypothetical protein
LGIYYKNKFDLITSISLICKQNYTTNISNSISKKRLTKVERSKINIDEPLKEIIIGLLLGDGHIQSRQPLLPLLEASQPLPGFFFRNEKETSAGHLEARGSLAAFACFFFRNEKETSAGHLEARVK